MASRVVMPKLTDTMEEGVLLAWKKREGDTVQAGEALAEIETDKAVMDLEDFASGTRLIQEPGGNSCPSLTPSKISGCRTWNQPLYHQRNRSRRAHCGRGCRE